MYTPVKFVKNILLTILLLVSLFSAISFAQNAPSNADSTDLTSTTFLPIIAYTPETRYIGGAAVLFMYRTAGNEDSRPSMIIPVFQYTQNKQLIAELKYETYLNNDKYFVKTETEYAKFPKSYYGLNTDGKDEEKYTPVTKRVLFNFKNRVNSNLYLGLKYSLKNIAIIETEKDGILSGGTVIGSQGGKESGIGFTLDWDSRNSISYSTVGRLFSSSFTVYSGKIGSDYDINAVGLDYREFHTSDSGLIFGYNLVYNALFGSVPFNMLPTIGGNHVLRGVYEGKFNDKQRIAVQGEIKKSLNKKIGLAFFAGTGTVSDRFSEIAKNKFFSAYGFGLRYKIVPEENLNLRFDFGFSDEGMKFYITVGEAF